MMRKNIAVRIAKLRAKMRRLKLDAALITNEVNVRYLTGFMGDSSSLFLTAHQAFFITDFRYVEQAEEECGGFRIESDRGVLRAAVRLAGKLKLRNLGVEAGALSYQLGGQLKQDLGSTEMISTGGFVEELREVKDAGEIAAIETCVEISEKCIEHVKPYLVPGIRERDIAAEMEYFVRGQGGDGMAFPSIVAFGPRGSLPHARATGRRLEPGDPILIDWGVSKDGYHSDLTRTYFHNKIPARFQRIYRTVLDAQVRAIRRVRPGVKARMLDAAARNHIAKAGFGPKFGHSLGHGIGTGGHEGPAISARSESIIKKGMVFTVEPGIYIPGLGGVRIEDDVLVTARGVRVLSSTPKSIDDIVIRS